MEGVTGEAAAQNLGQGIGRRDFGGCQDQHGGPFRHAHPPAIPVKRMRPCGVDKLEGTKPVIGETAETIRAARKHTTTRPRTEKRQGGLDRRGTRGTGGRQRDDRPPAAQFPGQNLGHGAGAVIPEFFRTAFVRRKVVFGGEHPAGGAPQENGIDRTGRPGEGLPGRGQGQCMGPGECAGVDRMADLAHRQRRGFRKKGQRDDGNRGCFQKCLKGRNADARRRDDTHPGDKDPHEVQPSRSVVFSQMCRARDLRLAKTLAPTSLLSILTP